MGKPAVTPVNTDHVCVADGCDAVVGEPVSIDVLSRGRGDGVNTNIGLICREHFDAVYDKVRGCYGPSNVYGWKNDFSLRLKQVSSTK